MADKTLDLIGIGNAIVDVIAYSNTDFLRKHNLALGGMSLVDIEESSKIYKEIGSATQCSGGSAANTLVGVAMLGGSTEFIGKVKNDQFGDIFRYSLTKENVIFDTDSATEGDPTGHCVVLVTEEPNPFNEDKKNVERTMATYLGASVTVSKEDVDPERIKQSKVLYFEGYLWDSPSAKEAIFYAIDIAKEHGTKVAFTLSDPFCVERHRDEFRTLVNDHVDILFANKDEITSLYQEPDLRKNIFRLQDKCDIAAITCGSQGSYVLVGEELHAVDPIEVEHVFDVTGAGDLYAAGFLQAYIQGHSPELCGKYGTVCATEIIQYLGARAVNSLTDAVEKYVA